MEASLEEAPDSGPSLARSSSVRLMWQMKVTVGEQCEGHRVGSCGAGGVTLIFSPALRRTNTHGLPASSAARTARCAGFSRRHLVFTEATCCEPG